MSRKKKIAAIVTTWYARSHADVIVTKFLKGFPSDDGLIPPQVEVVSLYMDQVHEKDVGLELAREHGVPVYNSIPKALTLGGEKLAVDGVLIIGEHGDYAWNEKQQHMYPRRFFFEQVCGVFATSGRSVPVFNDKHLAYDWVNSKWMYDRARMLGTLSGRFLRAAGVEEPVSRVRSGNAVGGSAVDRVFRPRLVWVPRARTAAVHG